MSKIWRQNISIIYFEGTNPDSYRDFILGLLKNLATLYRLDYAITLDYPFAAEVDSFGKNDHKDKSDLAYYRSNEHSQVSKKEFRSIVDCMFCKAPSWFSEGVEIWPQLYKFLKDFPFPTEFYRPLNYPWVEHHVGSQKKLLIYADEVMKVIEAGQDFPRN